MIMQMKPKVTMYTIAKEVGMSIAAVSRAFDPKSCLKPEKRELILETAKRLGYVPNRMASRLSSEPIRIGVLIYGQVRVYYSILERGIRAAFRDLMDYKVELDFNTLDRAEASEEDAVKVIDKFADSGIDGVIISGLFSQDALGHINRLEESGIPLCLLGSDLPGCKRSFVSMNDTVTTGQLAAEFLSLTVGDKRDVVLFTADRSSPGQDEIVDSFLLSSEKMSLTVRDIIDTGNREDTAYDRMARILSKEPLPGGVYCTSANSVPLCRAIAESGREGRSILLASDVFPALDHYLEAGIVTGTIYQDPLYQARRAFESMFVLLAEGKEPDELIRSTPQLVLRSNRRLYN